MTPRRYDRQTPRDPSAERRPSLGLDPTDWTEPVLDRLMEARHVLTRLILDLESKLTASRTSASRKDPLLDPSAPHNIDIGSQKPLDEVSEQTEEDMWWEIQEELDEEERRLEAEARLIGLEPLPSPSFRRRYAERADVIYVPSGHPAGWPNSATYGTEHWPQLRLRRGRHLDDGQRRPDRFELGAWWWDAIYNDPRTQTERAFETYLHEAGLDGVIWAAPTPTGRLANPGWARVVISGRRRRRTAVWALALPKPGWNQDATDHYFTRSTADSFDPELAEVADTISTQPELTSMVIARHASSAAAKRRKGARGSRT